MQTGNLTTNTLITGGGIGLLQYRKFPEVSPMARLHALHRPLVMSMLPAGAAGVPGCRWCTWCTVGACIWVHVWVYMGGVFGVSFCLCLACLSPGLGLSLVSRNSDKSDMPEMAILTL